MTRNPSPRGRLIPLRRLEGRPDELSDESLLSACAAGEAAALGALFDRHGARTAGFLRRISRAEWPDVADLLQATFLEAQRSASRYRGQSAVSTWLMGIAAHIASHHARSEHRRRRAEGGLALVPVTHVTTPGEVAERQQLLLRLSHGIEALPTDLRVAYVLCELEEATGREAAQALHISEAKLWRRLHEAKLFLRRFIDGDLR
jgi:RNA polymerase sigma-70 factor (ECF subfamily)